MQSPSSPGKSSRNVVTAVDEEILEKICSWRGYHHGLLRFMIQQGRVEVSVLKSGVVQFAFVGNGQTVQVCELDSHSNLKVTVTSDEPWLWEGTRAGGASLVVSSPIDLLEISAIEVGLIGQLESAVAGVAAKDIGTLISQGAIQNAVLVSQPCPQVMWEIGTVGSLNKVPVYFAPPAPYADWADCRNAAASGDAPLAVQAIDDLRAATAKVVARNLRKGIIGGIEIRFPRKRRKLKGRAA